MPHAQHDITEMNQHLSTMFKYLDPTVRWTTFRFLISLFCTAFERTGHYAS